MSLFENIRRIGIFMIAAQTVMHFAAGKQYEKYMKVITGVIILLMFVRPLVSTFENLDVDWQAEADRLEKQIQKNMKQEMPYAANSVEAVALQQIEQEVKERLNDVIPDDDVKITDVMIDLEMAAGVFDTGTGSEESIWVFRRVKVAMQGNEEGNFVDTNGGGTIRIDEIKVGYDPGENVEQEEYDSERNARIWEYQRIFAQALGITEDRVEVTYRSGS